MIVIVQEGLWGNFRLLADKTNSTTHTTTLYFTTTVRLQVATISISWVHPFPSPSVVLNNQTGDSDPLPRDLLPSKVLRNHCITGWIQ